MSELSGFDSDGQTLEGSVLTPFSHFHFCASSGQLEFPPTDRARSCGTGLHTHELLKLTGQSCQRSDHGLHDQRRGQGCGGEEQSD